MAKKPEISLPVSVLLDYPDLQFMTGAEYRAALAIGLAYWRAGCPSRTLDSASIATLAHMQAGQWSTVRVQVCKALPGLLATLAGCHTKRQNMRDALAQAGRVGTENAKRKQSRAAQNPGMTMASKGLNDTPQPAIAHAQPTRAAPYHNPATTLQPAQLATISAKTNAQRSAGKIIARLRDE